MREILFRGKHDIDGVWVYGGLMYDTRNPVIGTTGKYYFVIPETVGEYTGLKDKKGVKIFEGDVVKVYLPSPRVDTVETLIVGFKKSTFTLDTINDCDNLLFWFLTPEEEITVVGNIHDDPELLGKR